MEGRNMEFDPHMYFRLGKETISEGMKRLQNLVEWYNGNPEMVGFVDEIMVYIQSLQRQIKEIESLAQRGEEVHVSSDINRTDLHHGQEITQIREQNEDIEMVMNKNVGSPSVSKRKRWSKVWEDFIKDVDKNGKEWAECKHCKKNFGGSSKSGTTHLKNHLKSCTGLRNPGGVIEKVKEKRVIDPKLNDSDLGRKIIKYGLNSIKNDILDVYEQEKNRLQGYLNKLPNRFTSSFKYFGPHKSALDLHKITIQFINDSWEFKNIIVCVIESKEDECESVKSSLVDWKIDTKISYFHLPEMRYFEMEEIEDMSRWFSQRGSLTFIESFRHIYFLFHKLEPAFNPFSLDKLHSLKSYILKNGNSFRLAVAKAVHEGKKVTSESFPHTPCNLFELCEWLLGCKEAICELEHIDPDFEVFNLLKEDWDELYLWHTFQGEIDDFRKEVNNLIDLQYKTINSYFPIICKIFSNLVQLGKSDNHYCLGFASSFGKRFDTYWNNFELVLVVTAILDPRYKTDIVEHIFKEKYGSDADNYLCIIIGKFKNIFNEYSRDTDKSISSSSLESELNRYLTASKCPQSEGFDILDWWRGNSSTYPTLVRMARDFLSTSTSPDTVLDSSLVAEINDILSYSDIDDELRLKWVCTKIWFNNLKNN